MMSISMRMAELREDVRNIETPLLLGKAKDSGSALGDHLALL